MDLELQEIKSLVGIDSYTKGLRYAKRYIEYMGIIEKQDKHIYHFRVESEHTYKYYHVKIEEKNHKIIHTNCTCVQYQTQNMCKHIAACLIEKRDSILMDPEEKKLRISRGILEEFYEEPIINTIKLKKQLTLMVELDFENHYNPSALVKFKIGEDRLYTLNPKLNSFLSSYQQKNETIQFGKNFTYDPTKHYFAKQDEELIEYLITLKKRNPYYNFQYLSFPVDDTFMNFLELLKEKTFTIVNHGMIHSISKENPIEMTLLKEGDLYKLTLINQNIEFLSSNYKYAKKNDTLYYLPPKVSQILDRMNREEIQEVIFKEEDLEKFSKGLLTIIKDKIQLDKTVEDKIKIGIKPSIKIYIDLKDNLILANIKLQYQEQEIDYFDQNTTIIRDKEVETQVLEDILCYHFQLQNQQLYIDNLEQIGTFLEENLLELSKKYEVFTSDKIKETKVVTQNTIRSSFSIGKDNIMKFEFDLGNIQNEELIDILDTLKSKKKYYRLKSGDLINLEQNEDLKQLENLVEDMELSKKEIQTGYGIIPKYRAIYLDSMKKERYSIITTNNLFDELIHKFNSYKNTNINLSKKEKNILRDYQEVGVKWLYNIYKCGFGGILADEMGLGKSIQLIFFIKQILKEKKDAKILIVAPTALIYNWKNEFDKFGKELNYKVFAENKELRKQELEDANNLNIFITTYGLVRQDKEKYLTIPFEVIALDEAQNIKNTNAQMSKVVKELHANTKFALTGTPLENSVLELWSIFDFIMPGYLVNNTIFQKKYNLKDVKKENLNILENLNKQIKPFILRRKKKEVVTELPEKIENNIYIDLTPEQKKLYAAQVEKTKKEMDYIVETEGFKKGNIKILQLLTKLRQLCIDPKILYENYQGGSAKIENLVSLTKQIIENGHKILLFTSYKTALELVEKEFQQNNISTYKIDGSVSSKKRMELVDQFNKDQTNVFLITLKAGGTGLNLTSADVVIHLDLWWNPQVENQATDRAHRIGQKNIVEVVKLICKGTIEERILELQDKKKILSDRLIEGEDRDQNIISQLTEQDIKKLLSLDNEEEK